VSRTRAVSQRLRPGFLSKWVYAGTDWVIAASDRLKEECEARLSLNGKVRALLPPVKNPALQAGGPLEARVPADKKIGVLARLDPKKGHFDILTAMSAVQARHPDCELHIAGAEENLPWSRLAEAAERMGLRRVLYHGFLEHEQIWDFMKGCRIGLIASLGSEEVSRALLEWMAAGRPVVATAVGCIPEILKDGEGGFVVPAGSASSLAEKLGALLEDLNLSEKMGKYNLERAARDFASARFKAHWHEILYA